MANPRHSEHDDLVSIPVLTDVIVPGRSPMPRSGEAHEIGTPAAPAVEAALPQAAAEAALPQAPVEATLPPAAVEAPLPQPASTELEARAGVGEWPVPQTPVQAQAAQPQLQPQYAPQAAPAAELSEFAEPAKPVKPIEPRARVEPVQPDERYASLPSSQPLEQAALTERDAEHIAERLRTRFAGYLREEGRRVIEARCREALEEHTSWLVRQVTREVALALEGEVMGWVRDAVHEELAAHQASRR